MGGHGDLMVPLPRYATINGIPITELLNAGAIARLVERTRNGGAEIVQLLQSGSAYHAPAATTSAMIDSILRCRQRVTPVADYLQGQYGIIYGSPGSIGSRRH